MIYMSLMTLAVVSFQVMTIPPPSTQNHAHPLQWFFWGFSLTFSETGSAFIGNLSACEPKSTSLSPLTRFSILEYFGLKGVLEKPSIGSTRIPSIVFCVYQLMFAAITCVLSFLN